MRWAVVYATGEGQTERIAAAIAERLRAAGHSVTLHALQRRRGGGAAASPVLDGVDRVVVAGSIHLGRFARRLVRWCRARAAALSARRAVLVVVSLTAAGDEAREWAGLKRIVERFAARTAWNPAAVHHVAGRLAFSRYGPLTRRVMRRIARGHGLDTRGDADVELTDWTAVRWLADELAAAG